MAEIKSFIISLIAASIGVGLIENFISGTSEKNGLKKYLNYVISLTLILIILSPMRGIITSIPTMTAKAVSEFDYSSIEAMERVNSLAALHISDAVCEKFGIDSETISAELVDKLFKIKLKKQFGLIASDIEDFVLNNYGIKAEVVFYE